MSDMFEWAKKEVALACEREKSDIKSDNDGMPIEFDYGCLCYNSALKAFKSLCEDGHSGMSISLTKQILNRLIDNKPLTPIEDTEDVWTLIETDETKKLYQCKRLRSLFKEVYSDHTEYHDNNYLRGVDIVNGCTYYSGLISSIVNEMFPITMPYYPSDEPIKVYTLDFLADEKNGDYDTVGVYYMIKDGERIEVNRFFKESDCDTDCDYGRMMEITEEEFLNRTRVKITILDRGDKND